MNRLNNLLVERVHECRFNKTIAIFPALNPEGRKTQHSVVKCECGETRTVEGDTGERG